MPCNVGKESSEIQVEGAAMRRRDGAAAMTPSLAAGQGQSLSRQGPVGMPLHGRPGAALPCGCCRYCSQRSCTAASPYHSCPSRRGTCHTPGSRSSSAPGNCAMHRGVTPSPSTFPAPHPLCRQAATGGGVVCVIVVCVVRWDAEGNATWAGGQARRPRRPAACPAWERTATAELHRRKALPCSSRRQRMHPSDCRHGSETLAQSRHRHPGCQHWTGRSLSCCCRRCCRGPKAGGRGSRRRRRRRRARRRGRRHPGKSDLQTAGCCRAHQAGLHRRRPPAATPVRMQEVQRQAVSGASGGAGQGAGS